MLVEAPEGRVWSLRLAWHRFGSPLAPSEQIRPSALAARFLLNTPFASVVLVTLDWFWWVFGPLLELCGRRPWFEAISANPWVALIWRANGRRRSNETLAAIADELRAGRERPLPEGADWVGYGEIRLRRRRRRR